MMITGGVRPNWDAVVPLVVRGPGGVTATIDVVVDTGFNELLVLPGEVIRLLDLKFREETTYTLADGGSLVASLYAADVQWLGQWVPILVGHMEGGALLGMGLMVGCRLEMDVVQGGAVTIRKLR